MTKRTESEIWQRDEIQSPCTKVCVIHHGAKICIGCLRTTDEIGNWSRMAPTDRAAIIDALPTRKPRLKSQRRGGRQRANRQS